MEILSYKCNCCGESKPREEMIGDRYRATGVKNLCRKCRSAKRKEEYEKNKKESVEKAKKWNNENRKYLHDYQIWYMKKKRALENGLEFNEEFTTIYQKKPKISKLEVKRRIAETDRRFKRKNKEKLDLKRKTPEHRKRNTDRVRKKRKEDPAFRLLCNLRSRVKNAIIKQSGVKAYKTMELLGCTIEFVRKYLESKWLPGMTWENYGRGGWVVDHQAPCAIHNLLDPEEQKRAFHYSNLSPMWEIDNLLKSDKILYPKEGLDFEI
jgi:hypothetical protein